MVYSAVPTFPLLRHALNSTIAILCCALDFFLFVTPPSSLAHQHSIHYHVPSSLSLYPLSTMSSSTRPNNVGIKAMEAYFPRRVSRISKALTTRALQTDANPVCTSVHLGRPTRRL